ncbi:MAG: glycosyltransferase family 2 protein [Candidatus Promineifilaceae bacterium]|jgi:glycosyltransferase involved in cell wall biosynthesis
MFDSVSSYLQTNIVPAAQEQGIEPVHAADTSVIVPAFNEEEALPSVLSELVSTLDVNYEIIVVDDGSEDRTSAIACEYPVRLIRHEQNQGKGAAMKTGIAAARGRKIIFIDADATYPVDQIPAIAEPLDRYDLVRGIRIEGRDNIPALNRLGNNLFVWLIGTMHQGDSLDALTGLYGLRSEVLRRMRLNSNGFDIESEIVIKAGAMRLRSKCIPIEYNERLGEKKLSPVKDGISILLRILTLATMYNPLATYIFPGLLLWSLAVILLATTVSTSIPIFETNTFIVGIMAFLTGFQLVILGLIVNLYATETKLGVQSQNLTRIAQKIPRIGGAFLSVLLIVAGTIWGILLGLEYVAVHFKYFEDTEQLLVALALIVWGFQLLCTMFFLSLFAGVLNPHE